MRFVSRAITILSCVHVNTFELSYSEIRALKSRQAHVHYRSFECSPDLRAFVVNLSCLCVQTCVLSSDIRACMSKPSFVHVQTFGLSTDTRPLIFNFTCVYVQSTVRSSDFRALKIIPCFHIWSFLSSPEVRAFMFQTLCFQVQMRVRSCPDNNALFIRLSCILQTFARSYSIYRDNTPRFPWVHQSFLRACPSFRTFTRLSSVHIPSSVYLKTFVRSCSDFRPDVRALISRHKRTLHQIFEYSPELHAVIVNPPCFYPDFRAFIRLSCVYLQICVLLYTEVRVFLVRFSSFHQTSVHSWMVFCAFMPKPLWVQEILCVHNQSFVSSCPDFRALNRYLCVCFQSLMPSFPDYRRVIGLSCLCNTFMHSCSLSREFTTIACVHVKNIERS